MSILGENMNHCCTWCDDPQTIRVVNCCQEESLCVNGVSKDQDSLLRQCVDGLILSSREYPSWIWDGGQRD